jgi:putative Ca2+/H+ antiporter (TMEM165/GDT1 family)
MSLFVILVSEIGDKTFLIAAVMAMQHSRYTLSRVYRKLTLVDSWFFLLPLVPFW